MPPLYHWANLARQISVVCSLHISALIETTDDISFLKACTTPSNTIKQARKDRVSWSMKFHG